MSLEEPIPTGASDPAPAARAGGRTPRQLPSQPPTTRCTPDVVRGGRSLAWSTCRLMAQLVEALPTAARLILLGDQLPVQPAVEAGAGAGGTAQVPPASYARLRRPAAWRR
ncbi:MAG: hypothetical protein U5L11_14090 [Arhodomonas sp.]|nr:hypothetical protein [Arhodomonas sp.]